MNTFLHRLSLGPMVSSGAVGTLIQDRGLPAGETSEIWNIHHPEEVAEVYRSFHEVGAEAEIRKTESAAVSIALAAIPPTGDPSRPEDNRWA